MKFATVLTLGALAWQPGFASSPGNGVRVCAEPTAAHEQLRQWAQSGRFAGHAIRAQGGRLTAPLDLTLLVPRADEHGFRQARETYLPTTVSFVLTEAYFNRDPQAGGNIAKPEYHVYLRVGTRAFELDADARSRTDGSEEVLWQRVREVDFIALQRSLLGRPNRGLIPHPNARLTRDIQTQPTTFEVLYFATAEEQEALLSMYRRTTIERPTLAGRTLVYATDGFGQTDSTDEVRTNCVAFAMGFNLAFARASDARIERFSERSQFNLPAHGLITQEFSQRLLTTTAPLGMVLWEPGAHERLPTQHRRLFRRLRMEAHYQLRADDTVRVTQSWPILP